MKDNFSNLALTLQKKPATLTGEKISNFDKIL